MNVGLWIGWLDADALVGLLDRRWTSVHFRKCYFLLLFDEVRNGLWLD